MGITREAEQWVAHCYHRWRNILFSLVAGDGTVPKRRGGGAKKQGSADNW